MIFKKNILLLLISIFILLSNAVDINIDEYSVLNDNEPESKFKIVIWDNTDDLNFKNINKLSYDELKKKYKSIIIINEKNVISYYWDEQVVKIITNRKSYLTMYNITEISKSNEFFSIILNNKILYNGVVWKGGTTTNLTIILSDYFTKFEEDTNIIIIKPFSVMKGTKFMKYSKKDRKKLLFKELYNFFKSKNKIVHGEFPFDDMKLYSDDYNDW